MLLNLEAQAPWYPLRAATYLATRPWPKPLQSAIFQTFQKGVIGDIWGPYRAYIWILKGSGLPKTGGAISEVPVMRINYNSLGGLCWGPTVLETTVLYGGWVGALAASTCGLPRRRCSTKLNAQC